MSSKSSPPSDSLVRPGRRWSPQPGRWVRWVCASLLLVLHALPLQAQNEADTRPLRELKRFVRAEHRRGVLQDTKPLFLVVKATNEKEDKLFAQAVIDGMTEIFAKEDLRVCASCLSSKLTSSPDGVILTNGSTTLAEIRRWDAQLRGAQAPARVALFVQRLGNEISLQIYSLADGTLRAGEVFSAQRRAETKSREERASERTLVLQKARGYSLTHWFSDGIVYPNPHFAIDVVDQVGEYRNHLVGVSLSAWNPVLGAGVAYHYVMPKLWNATLGGKLLVSLPTLIARGLVQGGPADAIIEPAFTPMVVARVPIPYTPLAISAMASLAIDFGAVRLPQFGVGLSTMDYLPAWVLP